MNSIYIKSSVSIVKVISKDSIINEIINNEFLYSYIPSVEVLNSSKKYDAVININESNKNNLVLDYPNIIYEYKKLNVKDLIALIEYILERSRQEKGIICIHGAGFIRNDCLYISFGMTTGIGKSTLALELSKEGSNKFYSDEKILIDLNKGISVGRISKQYVSNDKWSSIHKNKEYIDIDNISDKIDYKIKLFIEPVLCEQKEYVLNKWSKDKFLWQIYEESSRKIRGTSRIFFDNTYPVQSLDTEELSIKRLNLLKKFISNIDAYYYKGNIKNIKKQFDIL